MKISGKQLASHLSKQSSSLYVVSGDEPLLVQEACDLIRAHAKQQGYVEKQRFYAEANFDWHLLLNQVNNLSLFSSQRFIEIYLENLKLSEAGNKALQSLATSPPADIMILIKTAKLTASQQATSWYKALEKNAVCVAIWPLSTLELQSWVTQRLQSAQLKASSEACAFIASCCEGNLLAAQQTIEKLQLVYGNSTLSYDDVVAAVTNHAHYSIFDLTDAMLAGRAEQLIKILQTLKAEGAEPILILWAITKELRQLAKLAFELKHDAIDSLLQKYHLRVQQKPLYKKCLQRHPATVFNRLLQQALQIDKNIKGMRIGNVWNELLTLSLAIAGTALLHPTAYR